jgi:hypothetical protein
VLNQSLFDYIILLYSLFFKVLSYLIKNLRTQNKHFFGQNYRLLMEYPELDEIKYGEDYGEIDEISAIEVGATVYTSSDFDVNHKFGYRLNLKDTGFPGAWCAKHNNSKQYMQIGVRKLKKWVGVKTQGRDDLPQWVKQYIVKYSLNGKDWFEAEGGKVFDANTDQKTIIQNKFASPFFARVIQICPVAWHGHISMRVEAYYQE